MDALYFPTPRGEWWRTEKPVWDRDIWIFVQITIWLEY
jgi:hypothetical protein